MTTIYLVRHAKPMANWGEAIDPGLDTLGLQQANYAAKELQPLGPLDLYTSPLRRCMETAAPLAKLWHRDAMVFEQVAEIPSPPLSVQARQHWLGEAMQGTWSQLQANSPVGSPDFLQWRRELLQSVQALRADSVIYSHYIAINVLVGAAQRHERVISFKPGHASVTILKVSPHDISIVKVGDEAAAGSSVFLGR